MVDLNTLSRLKTESECSSYFVEITRNLCENYVLCANVNIKYEFRELEFYLYTNNHRDLTSHCNVRQKYYGKWYVHHFGKNDDDNYSTVQQKMGIDLCFGNNEIYFGILIRGIYDINEDRVIEGPVRVLNSLFGKENECKSYKSNYLKYCKLIENNSVFDDNKYLYLLKEKNKHKIKLKANKRKGLNSKLYPDYANRKYNISITYER